MGVGSHTDATAPFHGGARERSWTRAAPRVALGTLVGLLAIGCSSANKTAGEPGPEGVDVAAKAEAADPTADLDEGVLELGPITKQSLREHPAKVAFVFDGSSAEPKKMSIGKAEALGYTVVDLSNTWTPYIFTQKTPGLDDDSTNRYRETYIGLANDRIDADGDELRAWERNYLELYGIPPSLQVVKTEWDEVVTEVVPCLEQSGFDPTVFSEYDGVIAYRSTGQNQRNTKARQYAALLKKAMRKAKLDFDSPTDREQAKTHPKTKRLWASWREWQAQVDIIDHAQRRFRCEKLFASAEGEGKYEPGVYDSATTHALASFERKHDLMGWGHFKADNREFLAMPPEQASHRRLLRVIEERVVTSAGIVEDGSALRWKSGKKPFTFQDEAGNTHELRDLATEFTQATIDALGLQTEEAARKQLAMLSDLGEGNFENLLVAVKMPPLPPYYSEDMDFSAVIDRGDVWYDFPYDELGKKKSQPRRRYPHLTLYVTYADQKIPLVHWRTTIGSWRNELEDGEVVLKYKNSDVGPRVWKDIVAAPVWIPPATTPPGELIKSQWKHGKFRRGINYDEIGPGYKSAYGLVAGYHIKQIFDEEGNVKHEFDYSIRTHGSVDYMSILRRYSHGCHRLYNMDAVRMFSFILRRRDYTREGQQQVGVGRTLEWEEKTYTMKIDTRGYKYTLARPIPVEVTSGRIVGARKSPIQGVRKRPEPPATEDEEIVVDAE
jgi:hypothetical protein